LGWQTGSLGTEHTLLQAAGCTAAVQALVKQTACYEASGPLNLGYACQIWQGKGARLA
jgi:hypothetical protein